MTSVITKLAMETKSEVPFYALEIIHRTGIDNYHFVSTFFRPGLRSAANLVIGELNNER